MRARRTLVMTVALLWPLGAAARPACSTASRQVQGDRPGEEPAGRIELPQALRDGLAEVAAARDFHLIKGTGQMKAIRFGAISGIFDYTNNRLALDGCPALMHNK